MKLNNLIDTYLSIEINQRLDPHFAALAVDNLTGERIQDSSYSSFGVGPSSAWREAATVVMLVAVGWLAGRRGIERRMKYSPMRLHLITAEDPLTLKARARELIRFPQLTMPLLAALTPPTWAVTHTDEITHAVDVTQPYDLVAITAAPPGAPHAYELATAFRANGVTVVMGGPHATLMPDEVAQYVDIVVVGEGETLWPRVLHDVECEAHYAPGRHIIDRHTRANVEVLPNGSKIYRCPTPANLAGLPRARRDLIQHGGWNKWWATKGAIIATRGCPHQCDCGVHDR